VFKPYGGCRIFHRQTDGFVSLLATAFHLMAFSSPVGFPSGWATSGPASRLPAARPLARGGVSVMAYFPVSILRNRPFIAFTTGIQGFGLYGISLRLNRSIDMIFDCASLGAIRFELGATVSTMMTGILAETGYAGCKEFITTCRRIFP
jgi:hypothetical protein